MRCLIAALFLCLLPISAKAQSDDRYPGWHNRTTGYQAKKEPRWGPSKKLRVHYRTFRAGVIGGRPAGCPSRFCGCGASIHLFGRIIPTLNLAANWLRFPRAAPAPQMVAARRGHVFVLKQHIAGATWLVHDSNSGGRRTRVHPRSISGYVIVNPHGRV